MTPKIDITPSDHNFWADFWYYQVKVNVFPFDTKNRIPITSSYKQYQKDRIPKAEFERWKKEDKFKDGMAIYPGKLYLTNQDKDYNNYEDLYLVAVDLDRKEAIDEFCTLNGKKISIDELALKTIFEQHPDDLNRAHVYLLSPISFPGKGPDSKLGIEVKSKAEHGIMFCCNSTHKNGYRYQILGTTKPCILSKSQALEMIQHINGICRKYGLEYGDKNTLLSPELKRMIKNLRLRNNGSNIMILEGQRHSAMLSIANSILFHHYQEDEGIIEKLKSFFDEVNQRFCQPESLPKDEMDTIWSSCLTFVRENKYFARDNKTHADIIERATELILENNNFVTLEESKEILYYKNGVYIQGGEIIIEKEAENIFGYELANKHITEIKGHIIRKTYHKRDDLDANIHILNLQNGLYDIYKEKLNPHTPDYLSVNQKPIVLDPNIKPKLFGKFLKDVLYPVEIRTAVESMAYTFYRDTPFEYFFKLFGYGSNGKSVFTGLLTKLQDPKNISNASISALFDNRFALSDLEFKDVNVDTELSNAVIRDTSILKKLTGGRKQPIRIERKNQKAYDTYLHAKLFFNANILRETIDQTAAYYRREVLISFPFTFEGKKDDPYLLQKLSSKEELSGIFNVLMVALRRILKSNGIFINEKTVEQRRLKSERVTEPVKIFKEEAIAEDATTDEWITKADLYSAYIKFCKNYKIAIKSIEVFGKDLKKLGLTDGKKGKRDERRTCWWGVRLTPEYQIDIRQEKIALSPNSNYLAGI
ncbi:MAG: phage/plasmid primase, P4 family [Candidatus Nitrosocosmicus sp.]|nr:phage/plasmid primase, P4 family [Candidatus Nitrosocosmicus sp.]MDN5868396.1 phage/plasmid primase, P4 family [Candidatus Nitrosocosmicus sp.]